MVGSPLYAEDSIKFESVIEFLEQHQCSGYEAVNLHGGEPTIHPQFLETLDFIKKLGYLEIHLQTNGIRLADAHFVQQLVDRPVTKFIISLHGDTADIQDSQTFTRGGFAKTVQGIKNVKLHNKHIRTNTVITNQNLDRLPQIAAFACDLGVDHLNFSNLHPVGSARFSRGRVMPTFDAIRRHLYPAVDLAIKQNRRVTLEGFPYCTIDEGHEQFHLNDEYREIKLLIRGQVLSDYDSFMMDVMCVFGETCRKCVVRERCGGVYPEYIDYNGWGEIDASAVPLSMFSMKVL